MAETIHKMDANLDIGTNQPRPDVGDRVWPCSANQKQIRKTLIVNTLKIPVRIMAVSKPLPRAHPDDIMRLQTIRGQIEALEARHVEDMTNEYTIKVLQLEKSASDARELLDSMEKEVAASPTALSDDKSRELDEARKKFSRLSSDAVESKSTSTNLKSDMMVLKRLRRDERQLLQAIFSDPEWNGQEVVRAYYDEINNIRGSLNVSQDRVAYINTAKVFVEMALRSSQACQSASDHSEARQLLANSQEYLRKSENAFAELRDYVHDCLMDEGTLSSADRRTIVSHAGVLVGCCQLAHRHAIEAGQRVQEARGKEENRLREKENELLSIQRDLVIGSA